MSELKATPGPWSFSPDTAVVWGDQNSSESQPGCAPAVCRVLGKQAFANAHLIAAAPEIYAALEQAVTSMQDHGWPNSHLAVKEARRALAKARGE